MNTSKFQDMLTKWLMPIAEKIEGQKHLQAIKDGMIQIVPIIIIGSFSILPLALLNMLPEGIFNEFIGNNIDILTYPDKFTNGLLSIYAAYFIAQSLGDNYALKTRQIGIMSIVVHLILSGTLIEGGIGTEYLGAEGLFTAIISAIMSVEIARFMLNKELVFKLPDSVPTMVGDSFISLSPLIINVIIATIVVSLTLTFSGKVFPELVMALLAPAITSMDTLPAVLIVIFSTQLLWFFGLHGPAITSAVWAPFAIQYAAKNMAVYAEGGQPTHFFTFGLFYQILQVTGSGLTLGLVFMMMRSKAKNLSAIGKVAIVPSLFGINEPVIFGTPIILNPFMFIPFVFGPLVITVITFLSMKYGLVGLPIADPPGFLLPGMSAFLLTMDWKAFVLVFVNLAIMTLIYYPFFKAMEADELRKEISL